MRVHFLEFRSTRVLVAPGRSCVTITPTCTCGFIIDVVVPDGMSRGKAIEIAFQEHKQSVLQSN